MIYFVMTGGHKYCPEEIDDMPNPPRFDTISYKSVLKAKHLPKATYIFTDFDRLDFWQIELSARLFRILKAGGSRVFNDPGRALQRFSLLKRLYAEGKNSFRVWDAAGDGLPDIFPVFLRTRHAHRGTLSDLLHTPEEASTALEKSLDEGYGIHDLMFAEYCAEPLEDGLFRKLAAFRIGDKIVTTTAVHEKNWHAKYGEIGVASKRHYQYEYDLVTSNPNADELMQAFKIANIEYGRADYSIVKDQPEIYEINTNPFIDLILEHPFPIRVEADMLFRKNFVEAFKALDSPVSKDKIPIHGPLFDKQRKEDRLVIHHFWKP